ncbi:hypothetical protein ACFQ07_11515, partial [Actinomadura adrarensis]
MVSSAEPETGAELKKEWVRREKAMLAELGFKSRPGNRYEIAFDDEWLGIVLLPKKAAGRDSTTVFFHPPDCGLSHLPAVELIRELTGGSVQADNVTLPGLWFDVPATDTVDELGDLNPWNLETVDGAVARTRAMVEEEILPWMRSRSSVAGALDGLGTPQGTPSEEAARLRSLA